MREIGKRPAVLAILFALAPAVALRAQQGGARPAAAPPGSPGATVPAQAPAPPDPRKMDAILARWEQASAGIKSLHATFVQEKDLQVAGVKKRYRGEAFLSRPNKALLQFDAEDPDKPGEFKFDRRILCTGDEVLDYDAATRQVVLFPLPEDARERALEEGPLRFLFGMTVADFRVRYEARLVRESETIYRIQLVPLQQVDRDAFKFAVLDLNKQTLLPAAIYLMSPNGKDKETYTLTDVRPNATWERGDQLFVFNEQSERGLNEKGWRVIRNAGPEVGGAPELEPASRGPVGLAPQPSARRPR